MTAPRSTIAVIVMLAGCGGTDPSAMFRGHFVTNATVAGDYTLAVFATASGGQVGGYGWAGIPGLAAPPIEPLIVSGQQNGRAVSLTLAFASQASTGGLYGIFTGANDNGELRGTLSRASQTIAVTFISTDTTASGLFDLSLAGGTSLDASGRAGFKTTGGFVLEMLQPGDPGPVLTITGASRPTEGTVPIGNGLTAVLRLPGAGPVPLTSGSLQTARSTSLALIGQLTGQATINGAASLVTVHFSAGCPTACH